MISYLDTSAAMKLLVEEAESDGLTAHLLSGDQVDRSVVASWLAAALRVGADEMITYDAELGAAAAAAGLSVAQPSWRTRGEMSILSAPTNCWPRDNG